MSIPATNWTRNWQLTHAQITSGDFEFRPRGGYYVYDGPWRARGVDESGHIYLWRTGEATADATPFYADEIEARRAAAEEMRDPRGHQCRECGCISGAELGQRCPECLGVA